MLIRVYDPRSLPGLFKAVCYAARRYPTFVVAGRTKVVGWDEAAVERAVQEAM